MELGSKIRICYLDYLNRFFSVKSWRNNQKLNEIIFFFYFSFDNPKNGMNLLIKLREFIDRKILEADDLTQHVIRNFINF